MLLYSAVWGQALSDYPPPQCRCRSRARASLRNRHQGPSSMGFEDEAEQSFGRPCRQSTAEPSRHANFSSLIGRLGSSAFRLSTTTVSMSLTGSCFFSNRPFGVKRFQTIHHHSVDVAHGLVLLFGIGTKALPVWDSKTRRNNLSGGLAVSRRQNQADMRTHLIHRPARDIFHC